MRHGWLKRERIGETMSEIAKAYVQIEPTFDGVKGKLDQEFGGAGESSGKSFSSGFGSVIGGVGKVVAGAVAAGTAAVGAFAASSIEAGKSFDSSMSQVAATMGTTVDQIGELRDFAQEMGSTTSFSATEAADALNYMALAGYDAETSMSMLPNVLNLAAAGDIALADASDMVTDAQTALGLSIDETGTMVDQMAKAASKSNTSVAQLGDAFLTVGANARNIKGGTQELSTVLGVLADNGIKGSEAGTHLRNIMLALNPTTDKAAAAWEELGVQAYDADGNMRDLPTIFQELNDAMDGWSDQDRTEMLSAMFNKTDLASINALLGTTGDRYNELSAAIGNADGAAQAMADTQLDNLEGDITLFKSALEGAQIAVSDQLTPTLREFVKFGAEGLGQLTQSFKEGGLEGAMETFGTLLSELLNKIIEKLPSIVEAGMKLVSALGQGIMNNLPTLTQAAIDIILMLGNYIIQALPTLIEAAAQIILQLAMGLAQALPTLIPTIVEVILTIAEYLIENIDLLIDAAVQLMTGLAIGLVNALPILIEKGPVIIMALLEALLKAIPQLLVAGYKILTTLGEGLEKAKEQLFAKGVEIINILGSKITEKIKAFIDIGKNIVEGIKSGIADAWNSLVNWFTDKLQGLVDSVADFFQIGSPSKLFADDIGQWIPAGIAQGIQDGMGVLDKSVEDMTSDVMNTSLSTTIDGGAYTGTDFANDSTGSLYGLLAQYLPIIASGENLNVLLEGDAQGIFNVVRSQNKVYKRMNGESAFA